MTDFLKIVATVTCILTSSICFEIKTFYHNEKRPYASNADMSYTLVGDKNNKYYGIKHTASFNGNILKVNYIDTIRDILIRYMDESKLSDFDKEAEIFVSIYFDPHTLRVNEVYFGFTGISPFKVMTLKQFQKIDEQIKDSIIGEKNVKWFSEQEIDETLSKLDYLDGHGVGFYLKQLMLYKNGKIPKEKLIYFR
ncbi:hypothetical protein K2F45_16135 [Sphingobacterium siyangense]|uniref:hypothetical protein n=1 Tax=Sphingobacterium siyangense TaxID=459529 RepID=UPI002010BCB1|nr:hypothetical protein [Sphingobacterium siyangense]UQA73354.1 hypothetical protein K2F45_16135 [Sphingobacterium siyangense]